MKIIKQIQWVRIFSEGTAIVVSILLAFAIDAWWERRSEAAQALALEEGLRADFEASQAHVERWLAGNRRMLDAQAELVRRVRAAEAGAGITVPTELLLGVVGAPTYSPTDSTYEAALSSGQIVLIENPDLHEALARWRQQIADTSEDELLMRDIVVHRLLPELSKSVRLGELFEFENIVGWFAGEDIELTEREVVVTVTPPLEAVLAERLFYQGFVVTGLADIRQAQSDILDLLGAAAAEN
jgi:hypothetical protein